MKKRITRVISPQHYGGKSFETKTFELEDEKMTWEEIDAEIQKQVLNYINSIPEENAIFQEAVNNQPPFLSGGEVKKKYEKSN